jgi:hypothetical protein
VIHSDRIFASFKACTLQFVSSDAPFGQVIGGQLLIEAPFIGDVACSIAGTNVKLRDSFGSVRYFSYLDSEDSDSHEQPRGYSHVLLLLIVRGNGRDEDRASSTLVHDCWKPWGSKGLLLPQEQASTHYARIGSFGTLLQGLLEYEWYDSFTMTEITIV